MAQTTQWSPAILDYMKNVRLTYQRVWPSFLTRQLDFVVKCCVYDAMTHSRVLWFMAHGRTVSFGESVRASFVEDSSVFGENAMARCVFPVMHKSAC